MKRILFIILILGLNFLNAASLSSTKSVYKVGEDIVIKVKDLEYHPKNWIAIYPKGKSSSGSNIIRWKWTKETTDGEFRFQTVGKVITKPYLPEGEYEARVMYKNSYTPEAVVAFSVKGSDNETPEGTAKLMSSKDVYKLGEDIVIKVRDLEYHPKNWIAIYPKGKSSAGSNVIRWKWTKETTTGEFRFKTVGKVISKPYLPVGEYEARVMYNNSYTPEAVVGFSVGKAVQHKKPQIKSKNGDYRTALHTSIALANVPENSWVAIYPKNSSNNKENIITWKNVDASKEFPIITFDKILPPGDYQIRLFPNNSYHPIAKRDYSIFDSPDFRKISLRTQQENYSPNEPIILTFKNMEDYPKKWIAFHMKMDDSKKILKQKVLTSAANGYVVIEEGMPTLVYDAVIYAGNIGDTKRELVSERFVVYQGAKNTMINKIRKHCVPGYHAIDSIVCSNEPNIAYAITYSKNKTRYALKRYNLEINDIELIEYDQKLETHYPKESISLKTLKYTPVYLYKKTSKGADTNIKWFFKYKKKTILSFSSNDADRALYDIHVTNKGKKLVLSYRNESTKPYGVLTDTYDISNPSIAKLIDRKVKPLR